MSTRVRGVSATASTLVLLMNYTWKSSATYTSTTQVEAYRIRQSTVSNIEAFKTFSLVASVLKHYMHVIRALLVVPLRVSLKGSYS